MRPESLFLKCVGALQAASRISVSSANELTSAHASSDAFVVDDVERRRAVSNAEICRAAQMAPAAAMLFAPSDKE